MPRVGLVLDSHLVVDRLLTEAHVRWPVFELYALHMQHDGVIHREPGQPNGLREWICTF